MTPVISRASSPIPIGNPSTERSRGEESGISFEAIRRPAPAVIRTRRMIVGIARNEDATPSMRLQFLDVELRIGVDADLRGDLQRLPDDLSGGKLAMFDEGASCRHREGAPRADSRHAVVGLDHVSLT